MQGKMGTWFFLPKGLRVKDLKRICINIESCIIYLLLFCLVSKEDKPGGHLLS